MTITAAFSENAKINPHKTAIHTNEKQITYQALDEKTDTVAHALSQYRSSTSESLPPKVAMLLPNRLEFVEILLGAAKAGWLAVTFDPKWSSREIIVLAQQINPTFLFIDSSFGSMIDVLNKETQVIICGESASLSSSSYENWLLQHQTDSVHLPQKDFSDQPFYMGFTSGTTGLPKGFIRDQKSWTTSFMESDRELQLKSTDHIAVPGPLVHSLFLFAALHALHLGATCFLEKTFSAGDFKEKLKNRYMTVMYGVPTMYEALFSSLTDTDLKEIILRKCILSGDKLSPHRNKEWSMILPDTEWISFYGSSELSFVAILPHADRYKTENGLGYPFSSVETSIRNHTGEEVAVGDTGELFARSPMVFLGYYQEKMVELEEWVSSGDIVWSDEDGFLSLAGRKQNKIVTGGLNVFPEEVEALLNGHSTVKKAAVTGIEDEYWGERTAALLVLAGNQYTDSEALLAELKSYCRSHLAAYKCPRQWMITNEIPLTTSGKPARKKIKEWFG